MKFCIIHLKIETHNLILFVDVQKSKSLTSLRYDAMIQRFCGRPLTLRPEANKPCNRLVKVRRQESGYVKCFCLMYKSYSIEQYINHHKSAMLCIKTYIFTSKHANTPIHTLYKPICFINMHNLDLIRISMTECYQ